MSKRKLTKVFAILMVVLMTYSDSFADIRIRFARGRTSATVSGSVGARRSVCYVAGARAGQTMNAAVSSTNGNVFFEESGETSYSNYLERGGDHSFCLKNNGGLTRYTLTVSIQ